MVLVAYFGRDENLLQITRRWRVDGHEIKSEREKESCVWTNAKIAVAREASFLLFMSIFC